MESWASQTVALSMPKKTIMLLWTTGVRLMPRALLESWVMFNSGDKMLSTGEHGGSVWNVAEWPGLKANSAIKEVIQLDSTGKTKGQPIWPKDVRKAKGTCSWYGTAPLCAGSCPKGTSLYTKSAFGDGTTMCTIGSRQYCCKSS